jgi:hypothetical protein
MTTRSKTKRRRQQRSAARRKAKKCPPVTQPSELDVWLREWAAASGFAEAWAESERLGHPGPYEAWFDAYHGEP